MPNHLQTRSDDMHAGKTKKSFFRPSTIIIIIALLGVVAAIVFLT